ncbi:MAG: cold shock domain-containing protein [Roseburia sp.]|nr:cold shock domain-containing protein [Roseburia sp.]
MYGKVTKYFHERGFGFIRGEDGNTYFIHHSKLKGEHIDSGYYVFFKTFQNDRNDYNAKDVMVIEVAERKRKHGKKNK